MQLRIKKHLLKVTAAELKDLRSVSGYSLETCKLKLQEKLPEDKLQLFDKAKGMWVDVPIFEVYRTTKDLVKE